MLPEKNEDAMHVQALAGLILVLMCALSLVGVALLRQPIAQMFGGYRVAPWLWSIPVSLFYQVCGRSLGTGALE